MQVDAEKAPPAKVVQVESGKGKAQGAQEGPVIMEKLVNFSQKVVLANDHEEEVAASLPPRTEGKGGGEVEGRDI